MSCCPYIAILNRVTNESGGPCKLSGFSTGYRHQASALRRVAFVFVFCLLALPALSDVSVKPTFGHPYILGDRIVFTSVDGTHLIALDKQGQLQLELKFSQRIFVQHIGDALIVQAATHVYKIELADGKKRELFAIRDNEMLAAGLGKDFLVTADLRFGHNHLRVISPIDYSTAWESFSIEEIVAVTTSTVVAVTAERKYENRSSFHLENEALRAFDRNSGKIRWSLPLNSGLVAFAQVDKFLAVVQRLKIYDPSIGSEELLIASVDDGTVLSERKGDFVDLWPLEGALGVFETQSANAAEFYACNLPKCEKRSPVFLSAKEILKGRVYRNFIITAGIYDSACFDRTTGERLWEKGQLEWSEPFDNQMVITDFSTQDQTARIVTIELATGREQALFSRAVTDHDKAEFRPW